MAEFKLLFMRYANMDSFVAPAVIAAVVSAAMIFCKDILIDYRIRQRETKILAIRIDYILKKYALNCKKQLENTKLYIETKEIDKQTGDDIPREGDYNVSFIDLPLNMDSINWMGMDVNIVSKIINLSLYIMESTPDLVDKYEYFGREEADNEYIKRTSIILDEISKINEMIEHKYLECDSIIALLRRFI